MTLQPWQVSRMEWHPWCAVKFGSLEERLWNYIVLYFRKLCTRAAQLGDVMSTMVKNIHLIWSRLLKQWVLCVPVRNWCTIWGHKLQLRGVLAWSYESSGAVLFSEIWNWGYFERKRSNWATLSGWQTSVATLNKSLQGKDRLVYVCTHEILCCEALTFWRTNQWRQCSTLPNSVRNDLISQTLTNLWK